MRTFNILEPDFEYVAGDPPGYRAGVGRFGHRIGARMIGATVYELPTGESVCPYHYHYGNEEWLVVLDGTPVVGTADGEEQLRAGDVICFRSGPGERTR